MKMPARPLGALAAVVFATALCACSALDTAAHVAPDSPRYYAGTRLDLAALTDDHRTLGTFRAHGMHPPRHPALDLPLSMVGDTLLLPFAVGYGISEPLGRSVRRRLQPAFEARAGRDAD